MRITADFEFVKLIGRGGFGEVIKVRNTLDGREYAIKIIPLSDKACSRVLREVQTLSRLSDVCGGVVRYYNAWLESLDAAAMRTWAKLESWDSVTSPSAAQHKTPIPAVVGGVSTAHANTLRGDSIFLNNAVSQLLSTEEIEEDDDASTEGELSALPTNDQIAPTPSVTTGRCHICMSDYVDWAVHDEKWKAIPLQFHALSLCVPCFNKMLAESGLEIRSNSVSGPHLLFIQMEHCIGDLDSFLQTGSLTTEANSQWTVFRQITRALEYIHSQDIIHRDLKPENCLFDEQGHVKISDFGLAKSLFGTSAAANSAGTDAGPGLVGAEGKTHMSSAVGTRMYMAPEVAAGSQEYDKSVDIFCLGLILFELWFNCPNQQARRRALLQLREESVLPSEFEQPGLALQRELILSMVQRDPTKRPSATEILSKLPCTMADCRNEVERLRAQHIHDTILLAKARREIAELTAKLEAATKCV